MMPVKNAKDIHPPAQLIAPFCKDLTADSPLEQISSFLDEEDRTLLAFAPWEAYPYKPEVHYTIAHSQDSILLKYYVEEKFVSATYGRANDPVYEDSCVEFFISFDEKGYYNFEFNSLGTCLAQFGAGRNNRIHLPVEVVEKIRSQSVISRNGKKNTVSWTLTLAIPLCVFKFHSLTFLSGTKCRVNFFKCGDGLPEPHYVTWANIEAREPDFHLPQFFGTLIFG